MEKCKGVGCGGYCECKYYKAYDSDKWYPSKGLAYKDHAHKMIGAEKCNHPGCGGWCACGYFKEDSTGKWFPSKDSALKYITENPQ